MQYSVGYRKSSFKRVTSATIFFIASFSAAIHIQDTAQDQPDQVIGQRRIPGQFAIPGMRQRAAGLVRGDQAALPGNDNGTC